MLPLQQVINIKIERFLFCTVFETHIFYTQITSQFRPATLQVFNHHFSEIGNKYEHEKNWE